MSLNHSAIQARLVADVDYRVTPDGLAIAKVRLAFDDLGKEKRASFVNAIGYGKTADFLSQHFHKGAAILVEGRLRQDRWEKDGRKHSDVLVVIDRAHFVGPKATDGAPQGRPEIDPAAMIAPTPAEIDAAFPDGPARINPDDLPF